MYPDILTKTIEYFKKFNGIGESEWVEVTLTGNKSVVRVNIKDKKSMDEEDLE